ncbi:LOB domain-containing protein 7-like [Dendrobium catenatum]|uniref:LOB domain-containing protein 7-like n=1 Tax=Dendrobium catenatum TaxID=906689 RepID=UPI0009F562AC|nr:LOB domain-containing protein 7-like [Dendrobium catenatum]
MNPLTPESDLSYSIPTASACTACAACKFQRRKCTSDCTLAPFFPADKQSQFLNVHRLFGVSNILKILKSIEPDRRQEAMNSIIFQSNVRAQDPAGGCYRIIVDLQRRINAAQAELQFVLRQIASFRAQFDASSDIQPNLLLSQQQHQYYNDHYFSCDGQQDLHDFHEHNLIGIDINTINADEELTQEQILSIQQKAEGEEDVDERPPLDMSEMGRHAFGISADYEDVESKVNVGSTVMALSSSDIEVEAKTIEQGEENDLKRAASFFTLTNYDTSDL